MSIFFQNIDIIDSRLFPDRRGFSDKFRRILGVSKNTVSVWRNKEVVPRDNTLERFARIASYLLSQRFNTQITITGKELRSSDIKKKISERTKSPDPSFQVRERMFMYHLLQQESTPPEMQPPDLDINQLIMNKTPIPVLENIPMISDIVAHDIRNTGLKSVDYVISNIKDPKAYALIMKESVLDPVISEGDFIVLSPLAEYTKRCYVAYRLSPDKAGIAQVKIVGNEITFLKPDISPQELPSRIQDYEFIHKIIEIVKKV